MDAEIWWNKHLDEYKEILKRYIAYPSVAIRGKEGFPFGKACFDMLHFMKDEMTKLGMETRIINDVFAEGKIKGRTGKKKYAIACHGDVVPPGEGWDKDPFEMYEKCDHLVGRGTTDNKGAGIAVLFALRYLLENGWNPENDFLLRIGSSEEIGMDDVSIAFDGEPMPDLTLVPDSGFPVVYGEKSSIKAELLLPCPIKIVTEGSASVIRLAHAYLAKDIHIEVCDGITINGNVISAEGKGRHPATPEGGEDALGKLFSYLYAHNIAKEAAEAYLSLFPDFYGSGLGIAVNDEESGKLTAVPTDTRYEDGILKIGISIRVPVSIDVNIIENKLRIPAITILSMNSGYRIEPDSTIFALNEIACSVYGCERKPYVMAGGTYARKMQRAIAYGMGSPIGNVKPPFPEGQGRAHQINESVHIDRMKKGFLIYVKALEYLDSCEE